MIDVDTMMPIPRRAFFKEDQVGERIVKGRSTETQLVSQFQEEIIVVRHETMYGGTVKSSPSAIPFLWFNSRIIFGRIELRL